MTLASFRLLDLEFKSYGLNGNSISRFKAPLSAFLGSGVPSIHPMGESRFWSVLGVF